MEELEDMQDFREKAEAFVGPNSYFYIEKWENNKDRSTKGWNWSSLFCGIEWMAYRKMYIEILIGFGIIIALSLFVSFLNVYSNRIWINPTVLGYALRIWFGILGNIIYREKFKRVLKKAEQFDESYQVGYIKEQGGVSKRSVVVCIVIEMIFLPMMMLL